jgi:fermentation-respiration switch protein FrsA (DUF1100 family)
MSGETLTVEPVDVKSFHVRSIERAAAVGLCLANASIMIPFAVITRISVGRKNVFQSRATSRVKRASLQLVAIVVMSLLASCASTVRSRIFLPEPMPANVSWSGRAPQDVIATTDDGLRLRGYYWPPPSAGGDLILFFHGQSGNRYTAARIAAPLASGGGLLVASYRGYGDNPGTPDEPGLYSDARAFLSLARTLAPKSRIYLFGFSLGAAPALRTAADEDVAGVITLGAFTSLADVAPPLARHLLPDRFDNRASIKRVSEPILLLHAVADEVVPFRQAEALRALAPQRARLLRLEGGGHAANLETLASIIWENIHQMPQ